MRRITQPQSAQDRRGKAENTYPDGGTEKGGKHLPRRHGGTEKGGKHLPRRHGGTEKGGGKFGSLGVNRVSPLDIGKGEEVPLSD